MKRDVIGALLVILSLFLPGRTVADKKEKKFDPRLKQVRTVFVTGKESELVSEVRMGIERQTCLKAAINAESADAILEVLRIVWNSPVASDPGPSGGQVTTTRVDPTTKQQETIIVDPTTSRDVRLQHPQGPTRTVDALNVDASSNGELKIQLKITEGKKLKKIWEEKAGGPGGKNEILRT